MPRLLLVVFFAVLGGVAHAQSDPLSDTEHADRMACRSRDIEACTRFLDSGRGDNDQRAQTFYHRAFAYQWLAGLAVDDDLSAEERLYLAAAESDLSEAIELSPTFAELYAMRGEVRKLMRHFLGAHSDCVKASTLGFSCDQ